MQLRGLHNRELTDPIDANPVYRKFTRFYGKKIPHFTRLNDLIKMILPQTMRKVNAAIAGFGVKTKVEGGRAACHDTSVDRTDIARPVDGRLFMRPRRAATIFIRHS